MLGTFLLSLISEGEARVTECNVGVHLRAREIKKYAYVYKTHMIRERVYLLSVSYSH